MTDAHLQKNVSVSGKITELLERCGRDDSPMPPTVLYCEGWLLRLVLQWFEAHPTDHQFALQSGARWYSEALLSSRFLAKSRGEKIGGKKVAETHTHADGVLGHFNISPGEKGGGQARLRADAKQLVVIEAKLGSSLSPKTTNAENYGQAARTVACMVHVVESAGLRPDALESLGFYVVAPERQIQANVFKNFVTKPHIRSQVENRVAQYCGRHDEWFENSFVPALEKIEVGILSWESIIHHIARHDANYALGEFYMRCLQYAQLN